MGLSLLGEPWEGPRAPVLWSLDHSHGQSWGREEKVKTESGGSRAPLCSPVKSSRAPWQNC